MINRIEDALALPPAEQTVASRRLAEHMRVILVDGYETVRKTGVAASPRRSDAGETIVRRSLLQAVADLRRGSIHQHEGLAVWEQPDEPLLLVDEVSDSPDWLTVASWVPQGVAAVLFSPYPWVWIRPGGLGAAVRVLAGLESMIVLLLSPLAIVGGVAAWRSGRPSGLLLCIFFFVLAAGLGMTMLNVGSLFRLRLSALAAFFVLAGVGWARWREDRA